MGTRQDRSGLYALGHSDDELDRLETQARIVDPVTRRFWAAAGVGLGMRVLDVGCGAGHTTMLLAQMVGEHGQVVGIDNAAPAVAAARALPRAAATSAMSRAIRLTSSSTSPSTRSWVATC